METVWHLDQTRPPESTSQDKSRCKNKAQEVRQKEIVCERLADSIPAKSDQHCNPAIYNACLPQIAEFQPAILPSGCTLSSSFQNPMSLLKITGGTTVKNAAMAKNKISVLSFCRFVAGQEYS